MIFALVNTMGSSNESFGTILSRHRSIEAAVVADRKLQRLIKAKYSQTSYLPTIVVSVYGSGKTVRVHAQAKREWCTEVDTTEARAR